MARTNKAQREALALQNMAEIQTLAAQALTELEVSDTATKSGQSMLAYACIRWSEVSAEGFSVISTLYGIDPKATTMLAGDTLSTRQQAYWKMMWAFYPSRVVERSYEEGERPEGAREPVWSTDTKENSTAKNIVSAAFRAVEHPVGYVARTKCYDDVSLREMPGGLQQLQITNRLYYGMIGRTVDVTKKPFADNPAENFVPVNGSAASISQWSKNVRLALVNDDDKAPLVLDNQRNKGADANRVSDSIAISKARPEQVANKLNSQIDSIHNDPQILATYRGLSARKIAKDPQYEAIFRATMNGMSLFNVDVIGKETAKRAKAEEKERAAIDATRDIEAEDRKTA